MRVYILLSETIRAFFILNVVGLIFRGSDKGYTFGYPLYIFHDPLSKTGIFSSQIHKVILFNALIDIICSVLIGLSIIKFFYKNEDTLSKKLNLKDTANMH